MQNQEWLCWQGPAAISQPYLWQKNMVMGRSGPRTKSDCAVKGQQPFTQNQTSVSNGTGKGLSQWFWNCIPSNVHSVNILLSRNSNINCNFTDILFKNFDSAENWRRLLSAEYCWTAAATMGHMHLFWVTELQGEVFILFLALWTSHHHISISDNIWKI
jgi:hypothetical protein